MLVVHPADRTTDFLCEIYKNIDCEVIRDERCPTATLYSKIRQHDRVIFLGHGTEDGLLRTPIDGSLLISSDFVELLKGKECIYIWCNADQFVRVYGLSGFATGMIISEVEEAFMYSVEFKNEELVESNLVFAKAIAPNVLKDKNTILSDFLKNYPIKNNNITQFNKGNVFVF